jgi:hypothetical protein
METIDQAALRHACRTLLKPIVSFLMKCGMTAREFNDIAKSAFVEAASEEYGIKGRPTNIARVSLLTGISRKEVKRQRELLQKPEPAPERKTTDATRLLSGWHQDADFVDQRGQPLALAVSGDGGSFAELCARYAGDIPATTMMKELKRVGAVEQNADGKVTVRRRYYMPTQFDPQWIMNAGSTFADLGDNINYNLTSDADHPSRFLGRATEDTIDASAIPEFKQFIEQHGQPFLELVDDWLAAHRSEEHVPGGDGQVRLGAGLFLIQGKKE